MSIRNILMTSIVAVLAVGAANRTELGQRIVGRG